MEQNEMPLGFGFALAQNPEAMKRFSDLPQTQKADILQRVHTVSSKAEMQALVNSLIVKS